MLKIRKDFDLEKLKDFGFKLEPERSYYYKIIGEDIYLSIQKTKNGKPFKEREIGIDCQYGTYINELDVLYDLILLGIIVKE